MTGIQSITYVEGDATVPHAGMQRNKLICHIVNNRGKWGSGFVVPLGEKYPQAQRAYREWATGEFHSSFTAHAYGSLQLGVVQSVIVRTDLMVVNMCAQDGLPTRERPRVVNYDALSKCFDATRRIASYYGASIHMPRIGCGRGGGRWEEVLEVLSVPTVGQFEPDIYVYDPAKGVQVG